MRWKEYLELLADIVQFVVTLFALVTVTILIVRGMCARPA